ncbi:MAG: calcium/sodium antiporter [Candidatus Woesearchaeota archaeon]
MVEIIITLVLIVVGLFLLVKGADYLIDGAADIARRLRVPPIIIGLTIVGFGTSLPELMVSLFAAFSGSSSISIGTIIGSNIANIGIGIGVAALFSGLVIKSKTLMYELPILLAATTFLIIFSNDFYIFQNNTFSLGRIDGIIFMLVFIVFMFYILRTVKENRANVGKDIKKDIKEELGTTEPLWQNILRIIGGTFALLGGGKLFIYAAEKLAISAGVSELFIGVTISAIGTSLPELIVTIKAAWRGHGDIAVGNIVGSCIFNILFALGLTSLIKPINILPSVISTDGMILVFITILLLLFSSSSKKIDRWEGAVLILTYLAYFGFIVWRL